MAFVISLAKPTFSGGAHFHPPDSGGRTSLPFMGDQGDEVGSNWCSLRNTRFIGHSPLEGVLRGQGYSRGRHRCFVEKRPYTTMLMAIGLWSLFARLR